MKKSIFFVLTLSAMAFSSCMSEEEMFQPLDNSLATIELNISNNEELNVSTRATQTVANPDNWCASVTANSGGTVPENIAKVSDLKSKTFQPGYYNFTVSSHVNLEASLADNTSAGGAYYKATLDNEELSAGVNTLTFNCGAAQNSMITVDWSGATGVEGLEFNSVTATQGGRTYTYSSGGSAFFDAGPDKTVNCTLNYSFDGKDKHIPKEIAVTNPATNYKLTITANTNGSITTITINYDDFTDGDDTTVTIDAATGDEDKTQPSGAGE